MHKITMAASMLLVLTMFLQLATCALASERGSSMQVGDLLNVNERLVSPGKTFQFGIFNDTIDAPGELRVGVRFHSGMETTVWTAASLSKVSVNVKVGLDGEGLFVLDNGARHVFASCNSPHRRHCSIKSLSMQDNGNLEITNTAGSMVWQSFDFPTDTLLQDQVLKNKALRKGSYSLQMGKTSANLTFSAGPEWNSTSYWSIGSWNNSGIQNQTSTLVFNSSGIVTFTSSRNVSDQYIYSLDFSFTPPPERVIRMLKLESNGSLRMYSLTADNSSWNVVWQALLFECQIHGTCGPFGVCTYAPALTCVCPLGFHFLDPSNRTKGCTYDVPLKVECNHTRSQNWVRLDRTSYDQNDYVKDQTPTSLERCKNRCATDCNCLGFVYQVNSHGTCYIKGPAKPGQPQVIYNGYQKPSILSVTYLKVSSASQEDSLDKLFSTFVNATNVWKNVEFKHFYTPFKLIILVACAATEFLLLAAAGLIWWFYNEKRIQGLSEALEQVKWGVTKFTYHQLESVTGNFKDKLGAGGFGTVFKGVLSDGVTLVAVKNIEMATQAEMQFQAEVATLGKIHHINLVRLLGYCAEGSHRLLVYEYMPNGSLDKVLPTKAVNKEEIPQSLCEWKTRLSIALGIARGICYLHEQCEEHIVHCDIKPENILLDENFHPKVADFGLAKLVKRESSVAITTARGTQGYIAPEWILNIPITPKVDVYSFGMVLLELMSGREKFLFTCSALENDRWNFPAWAFQQYLARNIQVTADPRMTETIDWNQFEMALRIAFWCIQREPETRPSMSKVIQMFEENAPVPEPPEPAGGIFDSDEVISNELTVDSSFLGR